MFPGADGLEPLRLPYRLAPDAAAAASVIDPVFQILAERRVLRPDRRLAPSGVFGVGARHIGADMTEPVRPAGRLAPPGSCGAVVLDRGGGSA